MKPNSHSHYHQLPATPQGYHGYRFVRKRSSFLTHPRQDRVEHRTVLSESDRTCNFQKLQRKLKKKKKTIIRRIQSSRENFCFWFSLPCSRMLFMFSLSSRNEVWRHIYI
ncbi:hypothetical protein ACJW30_01G209000 [Castanea mollissima]